MVARLNYNRGFMMKTKSIAAGILLAASGSAFSADYVIDTQGAHAFIQFKIQHLGYSWLYGRFNTFEGDLSFDPKKPEASKIQVTIDTASVDSNHAERDAHLRRDDFLDVEKFPTATFESTNVTLDADGGYTVKGNLNLHGVTKEIAIDAEMVGMGPDPWGGERVGFEGTTTFALKDFGIMKNLGPASQDVQMILSVEGIKKK